MFVAQASPDPVIAWNVVLTFLILVTLAATIVGLVRGNRAQKREVTFGFEPASKSEFDALAAENSRVHDQLFSKISTVGRLADEKLEERMKEVHAERREDIRTLHQEINDVGKKVAGLEKETEIQNQRMASMDAKLDRLIERHTQI